MKYVLIIGSSGGIGDALTQLYINQVDFMVFGLSRTNILSHEQFIQVKADLNSDISLKNAISKIINIVKLDNQYTFDIINSAAFGYPKDFSSESIKKLEYSLKINFLSPIFLIKSLLDSFTINRVLNITSGAAMFPLKNLFEYCTSKTAMHHAIKCLSLEYPNTGFANFRPGMVDTPLISRWAQVEDSIFLNGNPYKLAKDNKQLESPIKIAQAIFKIMNNPDNSIFSKDWDMKTFETL